MNSFHKFRIPHSRRGVGPMAPYGPEAAFHNQTLYPVILPVPGQVQEFKPKDRVIFLSRHARRALERSAAKSEIHTGELFKDESGMPQPFDGTFWSITHKTQYVAGVWRPHPSASILKESVIFPGVFLERPPLIGNGLWQTRRESHY